MKNKILYSIFLSFLLPFMGMAQPYSIDDTYIFPDFEAEFPGGYDSLKSYISNNLVIPLVVLENRFQGKVYLKFVVEKDGSVSIVRIERGISGCSECDKEAVAFVKAMPKWKPAYSKHYYTRTEYFPEFTIDGKKQILTDSVPVRFERYWPIKFKSKNYPILPQGYDTLKNYLTSNLIYPKRALKEKIEGKVYVKLLFEETGKIQDVVLFKGIENCTECDKEAIRLMKSIPKEIMTANDGYDSPKPFFFNTYINFNSGLSE